MKMVKSLVLGSAAALAVMGGAQAADLPVKAKAVEYVRICSLYGAGFFYIPGTDTCIKLGGYLRAEAGFGTNSIYGGAYNGIAGTQNRYRNYYTARSREDLNIDTRTATEYGVVRTFFDATFSWTTGTQGVAATGTTLGADGVAGGTLGVYYAFIQFAGFTMGKAVSQFDTPWSNYPGQQLRRLGRRWGRRNRRQPVQLHLAVWQRRFGDNFGAGRGGVLSDEYLEYGELWSCCAAAHHDSCLTGAYFLEHIRSDTCDRRVWCAVVGRQRCPRHRRSDPCRSGLGSIPGIGRGA
jgi:hypothetical protein